MCKNLVQIIDAFELLLEAQDYTEQFPSTAEDSSTNKRFVQFLMARVLNKMNSLMEVSDTQAAAALLGMNAGLSSESFHVFDTTNQMKYILNEQRDSADENSSATECDSSSEGSLKNFIEHSSVSTISSVNGSPPPLVENEVTHIIEDNQSNVGSACFSNISDVEGEGNDEAKISPAELNCPFELAYEGDSNYGGSPVYWIQNGKVPVVVPAPSLYRYRGEKLRQLNRWEYYSIVQVKKATKSDEEDEDVVGATSEESGRKKNKRFDFGKGIMIFGSYQQMLRSKQVTLKFFAHPPRHPGPSPLPDAHSTKTERWRNAANKFALYFLMLF